MTLTNIETLNYLYSTQAYALHIAFDCLMIVSAIVLTIIGIRLVVSKDE